MKIAADTNLFLRSVIRDDDKQMAIAQATLEQADLVAVTTPTLCEFAWVLTQRYKLPPLRVAAAIRAILASANVAADRQAAEAGLAFMEAGGDFADGVIALHGRALGADTFASFDKRAVKLVRAAGESATLLS